ncbi:MAG TPA: Mur ligase domain-containing protein, partial [Methylomirabilota bacterium]|nr:Mur ligase domain-containing protein [Methylomirabilota bacterium]
MRLEELVRGVPDAALEGSGDVEVHGIAYDSRRVKPGDLFVAVTGIRSDGHAYAADAVAAGAIAVAVQRPVA